MPDPRTTPRSGSGSRSARSSVREALATSLQVALLATVIALVLGSAAAFAVHRFRFFGRNAISFLLRAPDRAARDRDGDRAAVVDRDVRRAVRRAHARDRRTRRSASSSSTTTWSLGCDGVADLTDRGVDGPRCATGWQTFRLRDVPRDPRPRCSRAACWRSRCRFDEIIVTNFTAGSTVTLPKFIFNSVSSAAATAGGERRGRGRRPADVRSRSYIAQRWRADPTCRSGRRPGRGR